MSKYTSIAGIEFQEELAREIATDDLKQQINQEDIKDGLGVSQKTISNWVSDIRAKQTAGRDCLIKRLSLLGWTQEEIAEWVELSQQAISKITTNSNFSTSGKKIATFLSQGKSMDWIADHYSLDQTLTWALRLQGLSDQERAELLGITLKQYSLWNYPDAHHYEMRKKVSIMKENRQKRRKNEKKALTNQKVICYTFIIKSKKD